PSFLGLREDKSPRETTLEQPAPHAAEAPAKSHASKAHASKAHASKTPAAATGTVKLTSPDKVLYPADGYTKQDRWDSYAAVEGPMLPALAGRPLALQHYPNGIAKSSFYRQGLMPHDREPWMTIADTPARTKSTGVHHLVADQPEALKWLA